MLAAALLAVIAVVTATGAGRAPPKARSLDAELLIF